MSLQSEDCICESSCPVCLRNLVKGQGRLGKPETCEHFFCFSCIYEWSKASKLAITFKCLCVYLCVLYRAVYRIFAKGGELGVCQNEGKARLFVAAGQPQGDVPTPTQH